MNNLKFALLHFVFLLSGFLLLSPVIHAQTYYSGDSKYDRSIATVHLELTDTADPKVINHYFRLFGYRILQTNFKRVQAVIQNDISDDELYGMTFHPYVEEITFEQPYRPPFAEFDQTIKVHFKYSLTDDMIEGFIRGYDIYDIQTTPRIHKSVIIRAWLDDSEFLIEDLESLIYVNKATIIEVI